MELLSKCTTWIFFFFCQRNVKSYFGVFHPNFVRLLHLRLRLFTLSEKVASFVAYIEKKWYLQVVNSLNPFEISIN